ncbi:MAG: PD40 domain-containing protein [Candidatus Marinimicrobia bacterium]|nr:PD40 domain-containing protein [Candidatus Neomarinimicrobiota bacterium]
MITFKCRSSLLLIFLVSVLVHNSCQSPTESNQDNKPKIVFVSARTGISFDVFVMNYDGSSQTRITRNSRNDYYPQFSSDGSKIFFVSMSIDDPVGLYVIGLDDDNEHHITRLESVSSTSYDPFFSTYDTIIVFSHDRDGDWEIYLINEDRTGLINLTNNSVRDRYPQFSHDGTMITYVSSTICIMNSDGSKISNLPDSLSYYMPIQFSPDDSKILFEARSTRVDSEIYISNLDASYVRNLTNNENHDISPSFSPDGSKVVFIRHEIGEIFTGDLYIMNSDGSEQTRLTNDGKTRIRDGVQISPDGSKILFTSERDKDNVGQVYIMDIDGSNQTRLTFSVAQSINPRFQPIL